MSSKRALPLLEMNVLVIFLSLISIWCYQDHVMVHAEESKRINRSASLLEIDAIMPQYKTEHEDSYLCTAIQLPNEPLKLIGVESLADASVVHHILLFGCDEPAQDVPVWECMMHPACASNEFVLYGWGKNAPPVELPLGSGFSVGPGSGTRTIVLQVHYLNPRPEGDESGVRLQLTRDPVPFSAGMIAFASGFYIPPGKKSYLVPNECCYSGFETLKGFAFRVHTHSLGRSVNLEHMALGRALSNNMVAGKFDSDKEIEFRQVVQGNPQLPQGFYPIENLEIHPGDRLKSICDFDSESISSGVASGHTSNDEMCNLYLMVYSEIPYFMWCLDNKEWIMDLRGAAMFSQNDASLLPENMVWSPLKHVSLPANNLESNQTKDSGKSELGTNLTEAIGDLNIITNDAFVSSKQEENQSHLRLGQVSGVAAGANATLWVFARRENSWTESTFDENHTTRIKNAIECPAIILIDRDTGALFKTIGASLFYMPHMISVGPDNSLWVADSGLHQVLKIDPMNGSVLLTLGQAKVPLHGAEGFCKPTHVIVSRNGTIYVADGYCNSRIAVFDSEGKYLMEYMLENILKSKNANKLYSSAHLPHSIALDECRSTLYVADREVGYVHSIDLDKGELKGSWNVSGFGLPYAVRIGPYGIVFSLLWDRNKSGHSYIVVLDRKPGSISAVWRLDGVTTPHDMEIVAAPLEVSGLGERSISFVVVETGDGNKSNMHKYVLQRKQRIEPPSRNSSAAPPDQVRPSGLQASHAGSDLELVRIAEESEDAENRSYIPNKKGMISTDESASSKESFVGEGGHNGKENRNLDYSDEGINDLHHQNVEVESDKTKELDINILEQIGNYPNYRKDWNLSFHSFTPSPAVAILTIVMLALILLPIVISFRKGGTIR